MDHLQIRLADFDNAADSAGIVSIVNAYAMEPQGGGKSLPAEILEQMVPGMKKVPGALTFLALLKGQPVGAAVCFRGFSTFSGKPLINVHDLSVLKEYRGQGIGTRLLAAVEAYAAAEGCGKVTLEVRELNPLAERLYRRLGYGDPSGFATRFLDKPLSKDSTLRISKTV
ncbi:N-acetyltransferase family protein [Planctomicrobium sp. SH661]|uniref:GNAT family N-acetyltransferase n=1 Tax=Planctomicrobium sp. SH661 TaxID=3448124 RepID=UPI003F5B0DBD